MCRSIAFYCATLICVTKEAMESCDDGWTFNSRLHYCYLAPHHPLTWYEAQEYCEINGGNLVSVLTSKESKVVQVLANLHNSQFLTWIGLHRVKNQSENKFQWSDGSEVNYTFFNKDSSSHIGNCVAWSSGLDHNEWKTIPCHYSQFFLCKKSAKGVLPIIMTAPFGKFSSPNYPHPYDNDLTISYFIELETNQRILITFVDVDTEERSDYIQIFDGEDENSVSIARLSGLHSNQTYLLKHNKVTIIFKSDENNAGRGFSARYNVRTIPPIDHFNGPDGAVISLKYPLSVPYFSLQHFLIMCPENHFITFNVTDFDSFYRDHLIFYDGPTQIHQKLEMLYGNDRSLPIVFQSKAKSVFGIFETNDGIKPSKGWRFTYSCVRKEI